MPSISMGLLMNPWIVGTGTAILAGLILYFIFGIGQKSESPRNSGGANSRRVGILNKGKDNRFINNSFENLDVGIQDEGEGTEARGNEFR